MWQLDALHDLQPMWIFAPEMMGGMDGDASIRDGRVVQHSYRSFLITRFLAVHIWRRIALFEESGCIGWHEPCEKKQTVKKKERWTSFLFLEASATRGQIEVADIVFKPVEVESVEHRKFVSPKMRLLTHVHLESESAGFREQHFKFRRAKTTVLISLLSEVLIGPGRRWWWKNFLKWMIINPWSENPTC